MTTPITKKEIREFQQTVRWLAGELGKFSDNYAKNIMLQSKSALMLKYTLIQNYRSQVERQRIDFMNIKNKEMVYVCTQEMSLFTHLMEIFIKPRIAESDLIEIKAHAASLTMLLVDLEEKLSRLPVAA